MEDLNIIQTIEKTNSTMNSGKTNCIKILFNSDK